MSFVNAQSPAVLKKSNGAENVGRGVSTVDSDLTSLEDFNTNLAGNSGANQVSHKLSDANSVKKSLGVYLNLHPSLADFDIKGDGTDESAKLRNMIASGEVNHIDLKRKTIRCDSSIDNLKSNFVIENGTLDFSVAPLGTYGLQAATASGVSFNVSGPVLRGAQSFSTTVASTIVAGDFVLLKSTDLWATGVTLAEWVEVESVSGLVVNTVEPISYTYNTAITVHKPSVVEDLSLHRLSLEGRGDTYAQRAIELAYCIGAKIDNVSGNNFADRVLSLSYNLDYDVNMVRATHAEESTGLAYGVAIQFASSGGLIRGVRGTDLRHVVAFGGSDGVCKDTLVRDVIGRDMHHGTLNTHSATDNIIFDGFIHRPHGSAVFDGVLMQGANCKLKNGRIIDSKRHGVLYEQQVTAKDDSILIEGLEVDSCSQFAVVVQSLVARDVSKVRIHDLIAPDCAGGISVDVKSTGQHVNSVSIRDADIISTGRCVEVFTQDSKSIDDVAVSGGRFKTSGASENVLVSEQGTSTIKRARVQDAVLDGGSYAARLVSDKATLKGCHTGNYTTETNIVHDGVNFIVSDNVGL